MTPELQAVVDRRNQQTATNRKRVFAKKATTEQLLEGLCTHAEIALAELRNINPWLTDDHVVRAAVRELESYMALVKRHLKP